MKTASVKEIREELAGLSQNELLSICLRLVKFKKENKELITYMVFESSDETSFVKAVQDMLDEMFLEVNTKNLYYAKKTLRKIVRTANRYSRYSGKETTEADVLIYVCRKINELGIRLQKSTALLNLYEGLLKKIRKNVLSMHEDLQYDYLKELAKLNLD
jgi:hypothetical protein